MKWISKTGTGWNSDKTLCIVDTCFVDDSDATLYKIQINYGTYFGYDLSTGRLVCVVDELEDAKEMIERHYNTV